MTKAADPTPPKRAMLILLRAAPPQKGHVLAKAMPAPAKAASAAQPPRG